MKKLFFLIFPLFLFSQTKEDNFISDNFNSYFALDRENIHLHLNKTVYVNNETIWFKGYVLDKKTKKLHPNTTNVFITLYDSNKKEISTKLFYCSNGRLIGHIPLDKKLQTGNYYLHAFTNFMNNFKENESSLFQIKIINPETYNVDDENKTIEHIDYAFEGGNFVYNSDNSITVLIRDCLGNGIEIENVKVLDENNKVVNTFSTNIMGFGKFTIKNPKNIKYKILAEKNNSSKSVDMDIPKIIAVNLTVNNYGVPEKTFLKISTNEETIKEIETNKLRLVINQNELSSIVNVDLEGKTFKEFLISNESFFEGINNLILVDKENNILSQRAFFNKKKSENKIEIKSVERIKDSIKIKGQITNKFADLSLSAVPSNSKTNFNNVNIQSSLLIDNYFENKISNLNYYFNNLDRKKKYELDLFMSFNKYKYNLKDVLDEKPSNKYEFQIGLNVSGKLNQNLSTSDKEKMKLQLFSYNGIKEITDLNEKNEFIFKNLLAEDSSSFYFSLFKKEDKLKSLNIYSKIEGNNSKFKIPFTISSHECLSVETTKQNNISFANDFPKLENVISLDTINLEAKFSKKLENTRFEGRFGSTGYKIDEETARSYLDVLSFIQSHGFNVSQSGGEIVITGRRVTGFSGSNSPIIYLDNMPLSDLSQLYRLTLDNIDEIYINKNGFGAGTYGSNGVIRIFTKKTFGNSQINNIVKSKNLIVTNGFQKLKSFENLKYLEVNGDAFKEYGTIGWIPDIYTNSEGNFEVTLPHYYQEKIKINIQGIDQDGELHFTDTIIQIMN